MVKNGNFTSLLTSNGLTSSGQEWQFHIATTDIYCYWHLLVKNGNFTSLLTSNWSRMAISHCYWHLVVKNGNFTLLILTLLLVVKNGNFTLLLTSTCGQLTMNGNFTLLLTSSGQEWQFHNATDTQWSRMVIWHYYWHLMVKNGYFTLLLTSSGQEWLFHIALDI